ncbi:MAG: hypothetical protein GYA17_17140 [Chloroflexi bacterium]|nr:hypothetical protein [Chloroflexota bacterium]
MKSLKPSLLYWLLGVLLLFSLALPVTPARAQTPAPEHPVYLYLFWGDGCPHCARAKPFLENLPARYPGLELKSYEVYYDPENQALFARMAEKYGLEQLAVPTMFIGAHYIQGYAEDMNPQIEAAVEQCLRDGCEDAGAGIQELAPSTTATPQATPGPTPQAGILDQAYTLEVPLIGGVDLQMQSAAISTALIAFVDGFNPCSLWVLSMLLALTLHSGSRKKVFIIGLIFLTVTALIYALFIVGLFSVLKIASALAWVQVGVALVALFFALVNIKDYFWYKEGLSLTIADDQKAGIFRRIRAVMDASQSFWGLASATVVLAAGVSLVEFSCTAGFPVIWVNLLNAQQVSGVAFVLLLLLYMLIYQLDELVIFFSAVASLKASRLEEKHGRLLKLAGGMLMLALALVMLVNPALMNQLNSSLIIFGLAFLATLLVLLVHRVLLPRLGIRLGSEAGKGGRSRRHSH